MHLWMETEFLHLRVPVDILHATVAICERMLHRDVHLGLWLWHLATVLHPLLVPLLGLWVGRLHHSHLHVLVEARVAQVPVGTPTWAHHVRRRGRECMVHAETDGNAC